MFANTNGTYGTLYHIINSQFFLNFIQVTFKKYNVICVNPTNIENELYYSVEESAASFTTIKCWVAEFGHGRTSRDEQHSERTDLLTIPP